MRGGHGGRVRARSQDARHPLRLAGGGVRAGAVDYRRGREEKDRRRLRGAPAQDGM